jgi:hypothetical protein
MVAVRAIPNMDHRRTVLMVDVLTTTMLARVSQQLNLHPKI